MLLAPLTSIIIWLKWKRRKNLNYWTYGWSKICVHRSHISGISKTCRWIYKLKDVGFLCWRKTSKSFVAISSKVRIFSKNLSATNSNKIVKIYGILICTWNNKNMDMENNYSTWKILKKSTTSSTKKYKNITNQNQTLKDMGIPLNSSPLMNYYSKLSKFLIILSFGIMEFMEGKVQIVNPSSN